MAILCSATVDVIKPSSPIGLGVFRVEVWGVAPNDWVREYTIQAKNETAAAHQGMERFQRDIADLIKED